MAGIDSDSSFIPLHVICKKEECSFYFDVYLFKILIQDFNCKCPYCGVCKYMYLNNYMHI